MNLRGGKPCGEKLSGSRQGGGANGKIQKIATGGRHFFPTVYEKMPELRLIGMVRLILILAVLQTLLHAQPKRVLYITHSAGYRHDCLPLSQQVMADVAAHTGKLEVTATEDLNALNDLPSYAAVVFFTSGELAVTDIAETGAPRLHPQRRRASPDFTAPRTRSTHGLNTEN